jgi:AcrR family transcriptional regulator
MIGVGYFPLREIVDFWRNPFKVLINQSISFSIEGSFCKMARTPGVVEDRREQIMDAALWVFARKGFDRATNKDIAQEAGITPGLIYHYFESKEELLRAAIAEHSPLRLVQDFPAEMLDLPAETLLRFIAQQSLTIIEDEHFVRLMRIFLPEATYHPEIRSFNLPVMGEVAVFLESCLAAKMESGELRHFDASLAAQIFGGSLMAFVIRRQLLRDPLALQYTQEQIADAVVNVVLHGLLTG